MRRGYSISVFLKLFIYLCIYFWLCWVFVSVRGLSLVVASGGHSSSRCADLSLSRPLLLWSTGSRCAGSVVVAHGPSCSAACGILPDQGSNQCSLHWQADSQPLCHQGSPYFCFFKTNFYWRIVALQCSISVLKESLFLFKYENWKSKLNKLFFLKIELYWSITASQYCVSFYCTTK